MRTYYLDEEAYEALMKKLEELEKKIEEKGLKPEAYWWNNKELSTYLDVSIRQLQTYRDKRMIKFSQVGAKIWYKHEWVQEFLEKHKKR
jgi:hypothetical protein